MLSSVMMKIVYVMISVSFSYVLFSVLTPWVFSDLYEYRQKNISKVFNKQESIELIRGVCSFGNKTTLNTSIKRQQNYINIPESMNKAEGIEFSYSFWMKLNSPAEQIILLKGIYTKNPELTGFFDAKIDNVETAHTADNSVNRNLNDQLTKCPSIEFRKNDNKTMLHVSFNTLKNINNFVEFEYDDIFNSSTNNPRWFLFSIAFKESIFKNEYGLDKFGIIVNLYVNEQHVKSKFIENDSLKLNEGDIHVFPQGLSGNGKNMFGDLHYYNHALEVNYITKLFRKGYTDEPCSTTGIVKKIVNNQSDALGIYPNMQ
jgi:hypothetical protein